jgi:uncharacterized protein (TIRG00374 family)
MTAQTHAAGERSTPDERSPTDELAPSRPGGRRRLLVTIALFVVTIVGLYFVLPKVAGLKHTWGRLSHGSPLWLAAACGVELLSIAGYAVLFNTVFSRDMRRLDWKASLQIPLAGIAAIRLVAAAGAGAVAVTVWALGRAGMQARVIACRMVANLLLQYVVFIAAVIVFGFAVGLGVLPGQGPFELTILPAVLSIVVAGIVLSAVLVPQDVERRLAQITAGPRWWRAFVARLAKAPAALGDGARTATSLLRERPPGLLGAVGYWGFDITALGFCFLAFDGRPAVAVIVICYFLGQLGSLLPLPGGIGGVEGAMIGSFAAFGTPGGEAVVAVLAYRAISFWLPTLPGIAGYFALRRTVRRWEREPPALEQRARGQEA